MRCRHYLLHQPDLVPPGRGLKIPDIGCGRLLLVHDGAAFDVEAIFDKLPKNQQDIILTVGTELEAFGKKGAQDDDIEVAKVYEKAGAKVDKLDVATVGKWRDIARDTAWKDYSAKTATSASLLKLASDVSA